MNLLFLRGEVPQDRDPKQIMFNSLDDCDDVWTQIAASLSVDGYGEVWYWNGKRKVKYRDNFIERWVPDYTKEKLRFEPDVIFARGGFPQYDAMLRRFPNAYKIYYGAGRRFMPQTAFKDYDLILVDSPKQRSKTQIKFPKSRVEILIKPAADNIFKPVSSEKKYDAIFCANEHAQGIKGHEFVLNHFPKDMNMIQTGIVKPQTKKRFKHVDFRGWTPRDQVVRSYSQAKFAIVWCKGNFDSCPRVIPEALACGCPLLIFDETTFWHDKYITPKTGIFANASNFVEKCRWMAENYKSFDSFDYYQNHLSIKSSVEAILNIMKEMT